MKRFIFTFLCFLMSINMALAGELISEQTQDTTPDTTDLVLLEKADNSDFLYATIAELMAVGNALTATSLAANGGNCAAGQAPLGVDASGAVESCIDLPATYQPLDADLTNYAVAGNALTATALAANGDNCGAGEYALGVNASGAVETCTDATTEIDSAIATHETTNVTAVLDCASGDCDSLIDAPTAFPNTGGAVQPDVSAGSVFITANGGATTIDGFSVDLTNGKIIFVIVNDANSTFDFTASGLEGLAGDYLATNGEVLMFIYTTVDDQWHYNGFPKTLTSVTISGFTATRPVYSDASGNLVVGDNGGDLEISGDDYQIKAGVVDEDMLAASIVFDDGDLLDFGTFVTGVTEGIMLPAHATDCSTATAEGQVCWEEDAEILWVGNGAAPVNINGVGTLSKTMIIETPTDADNFLFFRTEGNITVTGIDCISEDATSAVITVQECDGDGDNCGTTEAAITCAVTNTAHAATIDTPGIEAGDWVRIDVGAVVGTPGHVAVTVNYTKDTNW